MYNKVSVIIPTYNRALWLKEAIESVLNQNSRPKEIIVVDDGSNDSTAEIVKQYSQLKYISQENHGVSHARNVGIKASHGEWIAFLDSDDLWGPDKLKVQLQAISTYPQTSIFYTDEIWIRNGRRVNQGKRHAKHSGWIFEQCLPLCIISPSSVILHRNVFEKVGLFDESLPACEDYDLWLRIALQFPIHFISETLITKRGGHSDQLSRKFFGMDRFRVQVLEKILKNPLLTPLLRESVLVEIEKKSQVYAAGCLKRNRVEEYEQYKNSPKFQV
ncbi:MAG: glycosyltransferase [Chlamydiae bacterium]|nr:glycosyltransferase [Chlamydiota bacterium]MBI3277937.1 glycosyltransferase [Chlamydiota bacterium]